MIVHTDHCGRTRLKDVGNVDDNVYATLIFLFMVVLNNGEVFSFIAGVMRHYSSRA